MGRVAALLLIVLVVMIAPPALAHTEFDYSEPSADAEILQPVSEIVVAFTLPVTPVGNGFEVLDPRGEIHQPTVETSDNKVFRLLMSEALTGGVVGVRYEVTAEDGHVLAEGFSFTVAAAASTTLIPTSNSDADTVVSVSSTIAVNTTLETTTAGAESDSSSAMPWLIGAGLVVASVAGFVVSMRSRSSR